MAIVNSYPRIVGAVALLSPQKQFSSQRAQGFVANINSVRYHSYQRVLAFLLTPIDSTNVVAPRIQGFTQRPGEAIGDATGKIYNSNGSPITLESMDWNDIGPAGPWSGATILSSDPSYSFPAVGSAAGVAFVVPIEIIVDTVGPIWLRIKVSY